MHFRSAFHSSKANLCEGFSFYSFTRATAEELPTDRSVLSSLQQDQKQQQDILQYYPQRPLQQAPEDSEAVITLCTTHYLFIYEAAWCSCVMHSEITRRCSVPLYLTAQWAHFTRAAVEERGVVKAFMLRHQEELDSYEIQMGFCHRWLWTIFTLITGRSLQHLNHILSQ